MIIAYKKKIVKKLTFERRKVMSKGGRMALGIIMIVAALLLLFECEFRVDLIPM